MLRDKSEFAFGAAVALAFLALALPELPQHGLTIDSPSLFYAGDRTLFWLTHPAASHVLDLSSPGEPSGFESAFKPYPDFADLTHYTVFPGFVAAVASAVFSDWLGWVRPVEGHHLGLLLLHATGLFLFTVYACRLLGNIAGIAAAAAAIAFPCLLGHAFNNAKDCPAADFYGVGLLAGAMFTLNGRVRDGVVAGLAFGISLSSKLNGAIGLATWIGWTSFVWWRTPSDGGPPSRWVRLAIPPLVAAAAFVLLWPWLYQPPLSEGPARLFEMIRFFGMLGTNPRTAFTDYPLRCLFFMTPPAILGFAIAGLASFHSAKGRQKSILWLLVLWAGIPLFRVSLPHANFYDGNRHFLEYTLGVCALAGVGVDWVIRNLPLTKRKPLAVALAVFALSSLVFAWWRYRPYETTYFNFLIGGLGGAQQRALFAMPASHDWRANSSEGDYWYSSIAEASRFVRSAVPEDSSIGACGPSFGQFQLQWTAEQPEGVWWSPHWKDADYIYAVPGGFCHWSDIHALERRRDVVHRVERGGGLIFEILGPESPFEHPLVSPWTAYDK